MNWNVYIRATMATMIRLQLPPATDITPVKNLSIYCVMQTQRHVRVIPEIESPGHARAAIVSMKARYHKYVNTAPEKPNEYLLSDAQDTSRYVSAQSYTDNVMNVALPSTYRFMEKVIRELIAMYEEAEVPLTTIHLGGDEVPEGSLDGFSCLPDVYG